MAASEGIEWIYRRRSIRKYIQAPVSAEEIETLLRAAMAAPSANNRKPWHFIVVQERDRLDQIAAAHPFAKMVYEAPALIVVCGDTQRSPRYWVQDCSAATENILLAAATLGLGSVWLGVHPRLERREVLHALFALPEHIEILSMVALGHAAEQKEARTQYDPSRVRQECWNRDG